MSRRTILDPGIRRIAVLRALQLGDLLCAVPALRALRKAFPSAEVTLIGLPWAKAFAERFSRYVDHFLEFPGWPGLPERAVDADGVPEFLLRCQARRFDLAIQMHGAGSFVNPLVALLGARRAAGYGAAGAFRPDRELFMPIPAALPEPRQHLALMTFLGVPAQGEELEFPITAEDRRMFAAHDKMWALRPGTYVCVHPGARWASRRWPPERFAAAADALSAAGLGVVLTGSAAEMELTRSVKESMRGPALDLAGETSLGSLAVLLEKSRLLVCNDTGLSHLAAALRVPSVVVASGSDAGRWAPLDRARHRVISHDVDCRPCAHVECPIGHPCALGVQVEAVVREALNLLKEGPVHAAA